MRFRQFLALWEENVGPQLMSATDTVPDLPSANRIKYHRLRRSYINPGNPPAPLAPGMVRPALAEMMPREPAENQMTHTPDPNQMQMAAAIKPTGEIEDALAQVPPQEVVNEHPQFSRRTLSELFNAHAPVKQVNPNTYVFQIDDKVFQIDFSPASTPGAFEVVLARKNVADYKNPFDTLNDFGKSPIVVFSTAIGIIQKWLRINQPEVVFFYGFGPGQQRAYAKMANYLSQRSEDYVVQQQNGTVAFVRRDLVQESGEMRNLVNRLEHDKMARPNKQIRKMKAVAMPGNTSTYPAF